MTLEHKATTPKLFWIISVLALLWYLFGTVQFIGSLMATQEGMQSYIDSGKLSQDYVDFLLNFPSWASSMFGLATIGGALASGCLLLRRKIALPLFCLSLVGAAMMYIYMFVLSGKSNFLPASDYYIAATVVIVTLLMIWFSKRKIFQGILR